jgi:hypothetical protein
MVYSQTKRTASISSIVNQPQGGGNKKAGFPYMVGRESWSSIAMNGTSQKASILQMPLTTSVRQSRGVGAVTTRYFN